MTDPGFEFLLPGTWKHLPVADPAAAKRVIARMTSEAVGNADDRASLRAEIRTQFEAALDRARAANADRLWLCSEVMPGVPLPASITAYFPALAIRGAEDGTSEADRLHRLLGPPEDAVEEVDLEVAGRPAIRRAAVVSGPVSSAPDAANVDTLELDYWVLLPDSRKLLLLSVACGLPLLRERLTQLFDLVLSTLRWTEPESPAAAAAASPAANSSTAAAVPADTVGVGSPSPEPSRA